MKHVAMINAYLQLGEQARVFSGSAVMISIKGRKFGVMKLLS